MQMVYFETKNIISPSDPWIDLVASAIIFNQFNKYQNWENPWFRPAQKSLFKTAESTNQKPVRDISVTS